MHTLIIFYLKRTPEDSGSSVSVCMMHVQELISASSRDKTSVGFARPLVVRNGNCSNKQSFPQKSLCFSERSELRQRTAPSMTSRCCRWRKRRTMRRRCRPSPSLLIQRVAPSHDTAPSVGCEPRIHCLLSPFDSSVSEHEHQCHHERRRSGEGESFRLIGGGLHRQSVIF